MGTKMAKLEIKLILAMTLLGYEYEPIDGEGNFPKRVPNQDRNDLQKASPPVFFKLLEFVIYLLMQAQLIGQPCYLKFKRTVE